MIYFNIGWMKAYSGPTPDEETLGAHRYLKDHRYGAESYNFLPVDGHVRGYRPGHRQGIRIERLGASLSDASVKGALVVWMAREPASPSTRIVGWYLNATVYRQAQDPRRGRRILNGERILHSAEAPIASARLLPVEARHFEVPSNHRLEGGFGQSPVWYGTDEVNERTWAYIQEIERAAAIKRPRGGKRGPPRNADPELRRLVERAAVEHATRFYESVPGGLCKVTSVERDAKGWDLEAVRPDGGRLLVEVKGLQGESLVCELTPNEYGKMRDPAHRDDYVVYVVCNALTSPLASVFRRERDGTWRTADGRVLEIEQKLAAVLRCGPTAEG